MNSTAPGLFSQRILPASPERGEDELEDRAPGSTPGFRCRREDARRHRSLELPSVANRQAAAGKLCALTSYRAPGEKRPTFCAREEAPNPLRARVLRALRGLDDEDRDPGKRTT